MKSCDQTIFNSELTACSSCDLLLELPPISFGEIGCCPRCGAVLAAPKENTVDRTLIVSIAGLLFYIPAVFFPLLTLDAMGLQQNGSIVDGFLALNDSGYPFVAIILLLTSILLPLVKHGLLFFLSCSFKLQRYPSIIEYCLRLYHHLKEWGMDEVYLIGLMVTLVKVYDMAGVMYEVGFFAFLGLVASTIALAHCFDPLYFWSKVEKQRREQKA